MAVVRQPGVTVTQNFVNALPALALFSLPNVQVGPAFQVISLENEGSYTGSAAVFTFSGQQAGTKIDCRPLDPTDLTSYPVTITLAQVVVQILTATGTGATDATTITTFDDATTNAFANILPGDSLIVTGSTMGNDGTYIVRAKLNNNSLQLNEEFAALNETGLSYTMQRNLQATIGNILLSTSTSGVTVAYAGVGLPVGLTYVHAVFGTVPILSANVLLSYRALRFDYSASMRGYAGATALASLQADFGTDQLVPENTLAFAALLAINNSVAQNQILALPQAYLDNGDGPNTGDEGIAYGLALEVLALVDVYAIGVLTENTAIHTLLKTHVDDYSVPEQKLERVGIINRELVTTQAITEETLTTGSDGLSGPSGSADIWFTDSEASFITDGVVPGEFLNVVGPSPSNVIGRYAIASVDSQTHLTLVAATAPTFAATGVTYFIDENLTKDQQAATMASYASALGDRRLVLTWPDVVSIPVGSTIRQLPGYFLNASVCALTTGLPTQQGFTNLAVATYSGVLHSNDYFSNDQLNVMASGGMMIFVQDVINQTPLYIRQQLTTDTSAIKFQEFSVTKNVDFIAKFIRTNHKQYIGDYNIVAGTIDELKGNAQGLLTYLKEKTILPKIGGVITSGVVNSIAQDPVNIDAVLENYTLGIPIPLNNLDITINV